MSSHTESKSGTRDVTYNLVSVLYHALQGAETYTMYLRDAENEGDGETAGYFQELIEEEKKRAERAKRLLAQRLAKQ